MKIIVCENDNVWKWYCVKMVVYENDSCVKMSVWKWWCVKMIMCENYNVWK